MGEVAMTATADQGKTSALRREAERLEEDTLYSSKGHFNAEDTWVRRNYWLGASDNNGKHAALTASW